MDISKVQNKIDQLEQAFPKAFVFVLDTTDRSFIYKSTNRHDCSEDIIQIDREHGIDKITKGLNFYTLEKSKNLLFLRRLDPNSFVGACLLYGEYEDVSLDRIHHILSD